MRTALRRAWAYWLVAHGVFKLCGILGAFESGASFGEALLGFVTGFGMDILVAATLLVPIAFAAQRWPRRWERPWTSRAVQVLSLILSGYVVLNGYLIYAVGVPLTYRLLVYTKSVRSTWEVLEPLPLAMVVGGLAAIAVGGPYLARWSEKWKAHRWAMVLGAVATLGLVAPFLGLESASRWGMNREPVWMLVHSVAGGDASGGEAERVAVDRWQVEEPPPDPSYVAAVPLQPSAVAQRHVVLWIGEGVGARYLPLYGGAEQTTPRLSALAEKGLVFDRFYANVPISIKALFDIVCGTYAYPDKEFITHINPRIACPSLMETLGSHGYSSGLFHGGIFGFTDKLSFFGGRGFDVLLDAESVPDSEEYFTNGWGIDDRALVDHGLRWLDEQREKDSSTPTFSVYVPIIPHYPYFLPPDAPRPFDGTRGQRAYLNGVHYTDSLFGELHDGYAERGLAKDTLFVFLGDHGQAFYQHPRNKLHGHQLYEENVHVPLVIINETLFPTQVRTGRLGSHVDIAPTLFELLGMPRAHGWQGQSVVGDGFEYRATPFFTFYSEPRMGVRVGDWKLLWNQLDDSLEAYDLPKDPFERVNRLALAPFNTEQWTARLRRFQFAQAEYIASHPSLDSHYMADLVQNATVEVETNEGVISCEEPLTPGHGWRCPGQPRWVYVGLERLRVYNIVRECIRAHPPPDGKLRIRFVPPAQPPRLVGTGLWDAAARKGDQPVVAHWRLGERSLRMEATNRDVYDAEEVEPLAGAAFSVEIESATPNNRTTCLTVSP